VTQTVPPRQSPLWSLGRDHRGSYCSDVAGELERTLDALTRAGVDYLVVGGVAVVLHGHLRTTADLDLVIGLSESNARRAVEVFESLRLQPRAPVPLNQFADPDIRSAWVRDKGLTVFSLWSPDMPGFEVDLFVEEPFDFEKVYSRAIKVGLDACETSVIAIDDLIELKKKSGRPRDLEDIAALEAIREDDSE